MEGGISSSEVRITVNEESLGCYSAVKLMQKLHDIPPASKQKIIIDLRNVKHFSASGLIMVRHIVNEFDQLYLDGVDKSIVENLNSRTVDH